MGMMFTHDWFAFSFFLLKFIVFVVDRPRKISVITWAQRWPSKAKTTSWPWPARLRAAWRRSGSSFGTRPWTGCTRGVNAEEENSAPHFEPICSINQGITWCSALEIKSIPTDPFTILEPQNLSMDESYVVQKCRSTDLGAWVRGETCYISKYS